MMDINEPATNRKRPVTAPLVFTLKHGRHLDAHLLRVSGAGCGTSKRQSAGIFETQRDVPDVPRRAPKAATA